MSKIITMSSNVGELQSGQTYRTRTRTALALIAASQATLVNARKSNTAIVGKGRTN